MLTSRDPLIRFVGAEEPALNLKLFADWLPKLQVWQAQCNPILFVHTVDMGKVFELLNQLTDNQMLDACFPRANPATSTPSQASLW